MAQYVKLEDKCLDKHLDPEKRRKIARAKIRAMVPGRLSQGQKVLLETIIPLFLEVYDMGKRYGQADFDIKTYMQLQNCMRASFDRFIASPPRRGSAKRSPMSSHGFDLEGVLDA